MEPKYILTKEQLEAYKTWLLNKNNCIWLEDEFDEVEWLKVNHCPLPEPVLPAKDAKEFLKEKGYDVNISINKLNYGFADTRKNEELWNRVSDLLTEFSNSKTHTNHIVDTNKKVKPLSFEEFCNKDASPTDGTKFEEELRKLKYDGYLIGIQSSNTKQMYEATKAIVKSLELKIHNAYDRTTNANASNENISISIEMRKEIIKSLEV